MSAAVGIPLTLALLALNAFFVGAEFALISARRTKIEPLALEGSRRARITLSAMERVSMMMAGAQLGITIASLALGSISEPVIAHLLEVPFEAIGVPDALVHPISFAIALSLVTYLHVVLGEMVPKNIALAGPERMAMALAPPLTVIVRVLFPLLWVLNALANLILRMMRVQPRDEVASTFTRDEVASLVTESRSGGLIELNDERLLMGALQFSDRDVRSVLLPMATLRTLPEGASPATAESVSVEGFSRFPLRRPDGSLSGYVHIKDLLETDPLLRERPVPADVVRTLPDVRATDSLRSVLAAMQGSGAHLAQVRDTDGAPLGVVTLEDVLEELVGVIRDDSRRLPAR
ncbi:HlyC/CorC family transporter [Occultella glacieicola]|uniref:HlyC/CorC family transporter n=1 Tax=Occultella glacieicola TaxID=2518684 RepID=A0ABY2DZY2_9MICO|nr:hemolysin family protein [Occultella glacieicola]TDE89622.1 HlyC/CorC family transporter [Occultella glacieicola]